MAIEYRMAEYGDFDVERVVEIARAIRPDDCVSAADLCDWHDAQRKAGRLSVNTPVAPFLMVGMDCHPDHHGGWRQPCALTDIGGSDNLAIERDQPAEITAIEHRAEDLLGWAEKALPRTMQFLERAGFREAGREWESTLDLSACDATELQQLVDRVTSEGVRIVSAATLAADRVDWKRDLHRL